MCYYPNWAYWRAGIGKFTVDKIDVNICTHIIYSFVALNSATWGIKLLDTWLDINLNNIDNFIALKNSNPDLKLLVALGGWTDSQAQAASYKALFATPSLRSTFIQ